jgi:hypothetical protein
VKAVGRVAKPLKPATARDPGRHGQPCQIANKSKANRAGTERRSQGRNTDDPTNGAFGFVQNAVNSLTSAPAKFNGVHRQLTSLSHRCDVVTPSLTRRSWLIGWRLIFFQSCISDIGAFSIRGPDFSDDMPVW